MNSKKAKRIRQLVKHLQSKGAVEGAEWTAHVDSTKNVIARDVQNVMQSAGVEQAPMTVVQKITRQLDPSCGKAIYKQMKKRAEINGRA